MGITVPLSFVAQLKWSSTPLLQSLCCTCCASKTMLPMPACWTAQASRSALRVVEKSLGLKIEPLSKPDLRQVTELVSTTTKWRRYLDFVIESIFEREGKKQKVKGAMKQLLRLGACEVLKLGQPSHGCE